MADLVQKSNKTKIIFLVFLPRCPCLLRNQTSTLWTWTNYVAQLLKDQSARLRAQADHITVVEKAKADAELELLAQTTNSFSPVAANLSATLSAAAPMDAQQVITLLSQMETRLMGIFKRNAAQQSTPGPSLSAASSGPQVSTGPPFQLSASPSAGGSNIPTLAATVFNEYDKAVEVDQRKLRNPELTPIVLRNWILAYTG